MRQETILRRAQFDAKLPLYWMLGAVLTMALTVIGIPLAFVWLIFGWSVHRKQFEKLECELTERSLNIRRGFLFRVEMSIPLDKIQDVTLKEGPILRYLGLAALVIDTAGKSSPEGTGAAKLTGVIDAPAFRDAVLDQRDRASGLLERHALSTPPVAGDSAADEVLVQIRDSLQRIEALLESSAEQGAADDRS